MHYLFKFEFNCELHNRFWKCIYLITNYYTQVMIHQTVSHSNKIINETPTFCSLQSLIIMFSQHWAIHEQFTAFQLIFIVVI